MAKENNKDRQMDIQAMMEVYAKLAIPGPPHKLLESMEGIWHTKTRCWMEPEKPPMESEGTCEQKMLIGKRFLQQVFNGDMMGSPFTGIGMAGYDNHTKKYVSTWMDSMGTGIYFFEGLRSETNDTIIQECHYDDPIKGPMIWRSVTKIVDENNHLFEMYGIDKTGKEEKMMEIAYTRKRQ